MRVIFLDIDGVLNHVACASQGIHLLPEKAVMISHLCEMTGAKVVISSTWRKKESLKSLKNILYYAGLGEPHVIDVTPCHDRTSIYTSGVNRQQRGEEIAAWLEDHPEVTQYVIFDDDSDMTEEQKEKHFVQTHWNTGITHKHIREALKIFMEGSPI